MRVIKWDLGAGDCRLQTSIERRPDGVTLSLAGEEVVIVLRLTPALAAFWGRELAAAAEVPDKG